MSCNWCQDKEVARGLIVHLCKKDNETWKNESNLDLCYCTPCVREYHRLKHEYITEKPSSEKVLYQIEVERLRNHFLDTLTQKENQTEATGLSEFPYDIEDYLKVPLFELLQYPYLLFNSELMSLFVSCLVLLIDNGKFTEVEEKLPGLYLLLVNPCLKVRKWALQTTKELGTISMEYFDELSPVINCILKIVIYGLLDNHQESDTWPIPMSYITDEVNPLPHLYHPLSKSDLWLGISAIFSALEDNVLRMLLSRNGNCQLLEILKDMLERNSPESGDAFWPLLFCLKTLMQKLESTFWLLTNFDDAPKTTFRLILSHTSLKRYLKFLAVRDVTEDDYSNEAEYSVDDEVTLSQLVEKCGDHKQGIKKHFQPFFWILPYMVTVFDLEYLAEKVITEVMEYLISLIKPSETFWSNGQPSELDLAVLNCLCNLVKYLLDKKLICLIKGVNHIWLGILSHIRFERFEMVAQPRSKRWRRLVKKSQSIFIAILTEFQKECLSSTETIAFLLIWLRSQKLGQLCDSKKVKKLMHVLPHVLKKLSKISQSGLSAFDLDQGTTRLFSFSNQDDLPCGAVEGTTCSKDENDQGNTKGLGSSKEPIFIVDSEEEKEPGDWECKSHESSSPTKSVFEPISYDEDLDYSEDGGMESGGFNTDDRSCPSVFSPPQPVGKPGTGKRDGINHEEKARENAGEEGAEEGCSVEEAVLNEVSTERKRGNELLKEDTIMRKADQSKGGSTISDFQQRKEANMIHVTPECIEITDSDSDSSYLVRGKIQSLKEKDFNYMSQTPKKSLSESHIGTGDNFNANKGSDGKLSSALVPVCESLTENEKPSGSNYPRADSSVADISMKTSEICEEKVEEDDDVRMQSVPNEDVLGETEENLENSDVAFLGSVEVVDSSVKHSALSATGINSSNGPNSYGKCSNVMSEQAAQIRDEKKISSLNAMQVKDEISKDSAHEGHSSDENTALVGSSSKATDVSNKDVVKLRSPPERMGVFDFLAGIKTPDTNDMDEEPSAKPKVSNSTSLEEQLNECMSKRNDVSGTENEEREVEKSKDERMADIQSSHDKEMVNLTSEAFQKRKISLYDQYVKKMELKTNLDESPKNASAETVVDDRSPEKDSAEIREEMSTDKIDQRLQQEHLAEVKKHKLYSFDSLLRFILSWHPVWLENEQEDELSIMLPYEPRMVEHKYQSYDNYMTTMWPLVLIEFFAQMIRDHKERDKQTLDYKFKSFDPVMDSQQFRIINCNSLQEYGSNDGMQAREFDFVILRCGDEHITEAFGVVEEVEKTPLSDDEDGRGKFSFILINLKIKVANLHPGIKMSSVQIEVVTSMVSLCRRWDALVRFPKSLLAADTLNPFRPLVFDTSSKKDESSSAYDKLLLKYNPGQANAIAKITKAVVEAYPLPKLRLLQGPPGTGKTHTLLGLVKNVLQSISKIENCRILICAPSNAAVDEIAYRLIQNPPRLNQNKKEKSSPNAGRQHKKHAKTNCGDFNLVRIGESKQVNQKVWKFSLESLVGNELAKLKLCSDPLAIKGELHRMVQRLKELDKDCTKLKMSGDKSKHVELKKKMAEREREQRHYEELQKKSRNAGQRRNFHEEEKRMRAYFLTNAHIICCTLSGAGSRHMVNTFRNEWNLRNGTPFACVIIDEAGQCCEPDALIPLQYGSSKLVLVGDPAQLPATILSKRAMRYGYGQSLFERIQGALHEHTESPVLVLQEQYRMHPGICAFPSQKFYNGNLITAREVVQRRLLVGIKPFVVLNINRSQETRESEGAIHNPEERRYVTQICKDIIKKGITAPEKIGVITPYRKQLQKLRMEMNTEPESKIEINTIDGFQGREKDIVILSCVRAQKVQTGIGFLQDPQRMNVALTRAKHSLVVLVHSDSLQVDEDWKDLIDFARSRNLLYDVSSIDQIEAAVFSSLKDSLQLVELHQAKSIEKDADSTPESETTTTPLRYEDLSDDEGKGKLTARPKNGQERNRKQRAKSTDEAGSLTAVKRNQIRVDLKCPHRHRDGTECRDKCLKGLSSPKEGASPNTHSGQSQVNKYAKVPHTHSDGTECVDKCTKMGVLSRSLSSYHRHRDGTECKGKCVKGMSSPKDGTSPLDQGQRVRNSRFPHKHSDGTECIEKCSKTGERSKPSSAYYKFPHSHVDGTFCETKCSRLEKRERLRNSRDQFAHTDSVEGNEHVQGTEIVASVSAQSTSEVVVPTESVKQLKPLMKVPPLQNDALKRKKPEIEVSPTKEIKGGMTDEKSDGKSESGPPLPPDDNDTNDIPPPPPSSMPVDDVRPPLQAICSDMDLSSEIMDESSDSERELKIRATAYAKSNAAMEAQSQVLHGQGYSSLAVNSCQWRFSVNQSEAVCPQMPLMLGTMENMQTMQNWQNIQDVQNMQNIQCNAQSISVTNMHYFQDGSKEIQNQEARINRSQVNTNGSYIHDYRGKCEDVIVNNKDANWIGNESGHIMVNGFENDSNCGQFRVDSNTDNESHALPPSVMINSDCAPQQNGAAAFHPDHRQCAYGSEVPYYSVENNHHNNLVAATPDVRTVGLNSSFTSQTIDDEIHKIRMSANRKSCQSQEEQFIRVPIGKKNAGNFQASYNQTENFDFKTPISSKKKSDFGMIHPERRNSIDDSKRGLGRSKEAKQVPEGFFGSSSKSRTNYPSLLDIDTNIRNSIDDSVFEETMRFPKKRQHSLEGCVGKSTDSGLAQIQKRRKITLQGNIVRNGGNSGVASNRGKGAIDFSNHNKRTRQDSTKFMDRNKQPFDSDDRRPGDFTFEGEDFEAMPDEIVDVNSFDLRDLRISVQRTNSMDRQRKSTGPTEISPRKSKRTISTLDPIDHSDTQKPNMTKVEEITQRIRERNASRYRKTQLVERLENTKRGQRVSLTRTVGRRGNRSGRN